MSPTPSSEPPPPPSPVARAYRRTLFDRVGSDAALSLHMIGWSVVIGIVGALIGLLLAILRGADGGMAVVWSVGVGIGAGVLTMFGARTLSHGAGAGALAVVQPSGASCPAEPDFSYQDAMAARGDVAGALASYESLIALASPQDAAVRLRAADLYARSKRDASRAAALYREVQRSPQVLPANYVYTTNRLIDLYMTDLSDPGKAMVELRRLIDGYPTSAVASHARRALATLKDEMRRDP